MFLNYKFNKDFDCLTQNERLSINKYNVTHVHINCSNKLHVQNVSNIYIYNNYNDNSL